MAFHGSVGLLASSSSTEQKIVGYDNFPMGSLESPLILRTFFPDPGLSGEVLINHAVGHRARRYKLGVGDVEGYVDPIYALPAAIGVNFGPDLSICWDTTECRLLYAWKGGFVDMTNIWGDPNVGRRRSYDNTPDLVGEIFYLTKGDHPLMVVDQFTGNHAPEYLSMRLVDGVPEFSYRLGASVIRVSIVPGESPLTFKKKYNVTAAKMVDYYETGYPSKITRQNPLEFTVLVEGRLVKEPEPFEPREDYSTEAPNEDWGKALHSEFGCVACHSTDGTRGHGPTFSNLYGSERIIAGTGKAVVADEPYLIESIANPRLKVVEGYPPEFMPLYTLSDDQIRSLVLYLKTLTDG